MKLKHVGMIVVSVLAMSSAAVSAAEGDESVTTTVNGGVIHFKGEVVNAACAIDSESMNQTVELGQVRSSRLAKAGDLSSAVGFNIKLNDCDTNVSSNAAVAFLGTTVTSNDDTVPEQNNILPYSARLKSTQKSVNPGLVRASATFTLEFQ
ncbi:fimbrial protein [Escherichia coli]|uniref:fimbrial protein n=1 Tax=Escherichia coli TaxID=562 RepID=UPI00109461EF|nr:fimbrial protein [Escherichia coli]TGX18877.1 fimbrial protein [Escherichia coli]